MKQFAHSLSNPAPVETSVIMSGHFALHIPHVRRLHKMEQPGLREFAF
jgi:hypothetical protein